MGETLDTWFFMKKFENGYSMKYGGRKEKEDTGLFKLYGLNHSFRQTLSEFDWVMLTLTSLLDQEIIICID